MASVEGRVLVVDDHATVRAKMTIAVKRLGHAVTAASDGRQALEILATESFDLVLLDLLMPEVDGFAVLEAMSADPRLKAIPVVVVSSLNDGESIAKAKALGAVGHLPKVFRPDQLQTHLSTYLGRADGSEA